MYGMLHASTGPVLGLSTTIIQSKIWQWVLKEHNKQCNSTTGCQTKEPVIQVVPNLSQFTLDSVVGISIYWPIF